MALGWGQGQQRLEGASFCWVGWSFEGGQHSSVASSIGNDNASEALENSCQIGIFTQVNSAEQRLQNRRTEGLFQVGEDVVHYSGYGDLISTGFQGFPVHCLRDEGFVSEAFEEGKWLVYGISSFQLLVYEVLEKSLF